MSTIEGSVYVFRHCLRFWPVSAIDDHVFDHRQCLRSKAVSTFTDIVFDGSVERSEADSVEEHRLSTIADTV